MNEIDRLRQRNDAIIRACQSVDPDFVVDGEDQDQERWTVCYNYSDGLGWLPVDNFFNLYGAAWVSTEEKAKEVCALLTMWETEELFKKEMRIVIEEIARVALGMVFTEIADELDLSDAYLLEVRDYLAAQEQAND